MSMTPQLNRILDALVELCATAMKDGEQLDRSRVVSLVESLSTNGWERHSRGLMPLSAILEDRLRAQFPEPAIHRGAEIDGVVGVVQKEYEDVIRWNKRSA